MILGLKWNIIIFLLFTLFSCKSEHKKLMENVPENLISSQFDSRVVDFLNDLKTNDFTTCKNDLCLSKEQKIEILNYERTWSLDSLKNKSFDRTDFSQLYTSDSKKWNFTDIHIEPDTSPRRMIEYVILTKNYIGIGYKSGGFVISSFFQIYELKDSTILDHWLIYKDSETISDLIPEFTNDTIKIYK